MPKQEQERKPGEQSSSGREKRVSWQGTRKEAIDQSEPETSGEWVKRRLLKIEKSAGFRGLFFVWSSQDSFMWVFSLVKWQSFCSLQFFEPLWEKYSCHFFSQSCAGIFPRLSPAICAVFWFLIGAKNVVLCTLESRFFKTHLKLFRIKGALGKFRSKMDGLISLGKEASFGFNSFKKPRIQRAVLGFLLNHFLVVWTCSEL